jgi:hypothetical protein
MTCINKPIRHIWADLIQHFELKCNDSLDQSPPKTGPIYSSYYSERIPFYCLRRGQSYEMYQ